MIRKHTRRCRDCLHFGLGYTRTTQVEPTFICKRMKKRIYRGDYNGERGREYYYSARPYHTCKNFEPKDKDGNKEMQ